MEVHILSKKFIKPSKSQFSNPSETFKLSFFDQLPASKYMVLVLYYPSNTNQIQDHKINNEEISNLLQKSLSEILTNFYPFAGRYIKESLSIDYFNEGAEFLEARVTNICLSQFMNEENCIELLKSLVLIPFESEKSPLVTVQFNMFDCGGMAIGVAMSHRIADTFTLSIFMDAWATTCRNGVHKACWPNFPFASICPAVDMSALNLLRPGNGEDGVGAKRDKIITKKFTFNGAAISNLKAEVTANVGSDKPIKPQVTRVKAVIAFLWKTLINVTSKATNNGKLRPSILLLTVNMRGRTSPTLTIPQNSCGNFVCMAAARFNPTYDTNELNCNNLVSNINDAISCKVKDITEADNPEDFVSMACNFFKELGEEAVKGTEICVISSLCGFALNKDFGWGMATWTSIMPTSEDGIVLIRDSKDGDGIEAWVNLKETKMAIFQQDPDVVALTTISSPKTPPKTK